MEKDELSTFSYYLFMVKFIIACLFWLYFLLAGMMLHMFVALAFVWINCICVLLAKKGIL